MKEASSGELMESILKRIIGELKELEKRVAKLEKRRPR